ncbi:Hint domain-containing protein [Paracoccus niistensis]|uniref:Hint domain-containing protein n=1 Tax=Paracoccus niistensis TaxID=632935 RepID=A0ABV6I5Y7_9RHOB
MAPRVFDYTNSFDTGLGEATDATTGGLVGLTDSPASGDADNEYVFFSENGDSARLELNADIGEGERITAFNVTMQLDINRSDYNGYGNFQPDGVSFNLTDQTAVSDPGFYQQGAPVGLSVRVVPYQWPGDPGNYLQILWNGAPLATAPLGTVGVEQEPQPFSISVDRDGNVNASWGPDISVAATIPDNEWAEADQTNWDFVLAGRTGGNGGQAYIDDIDLSAAVACFTRGTIIETDKGPRAIETLRAGDLVWTLDAGHQPIRWIGETRLDAQALTRAPQLRPIRIAAGALGNGTPTRDLLVSPQHRILLKSKIALRMFGAAEVLVAAKQLLSIDGIEQVEAEAVDYVHFLCGSHQVVLSNGALTESMYAGAQALAAVSPAARDEILTLFPDICGGLEVMEPARVLVPGSRARRLAQRHSESRQVLVAG